MASIKAALSPKAKSVSSRPKSKNPQVVRKTAAKRQPVTTPATQTTHGLSAQVYDLNGKNLGTAALPKEVFGQKVNVKLIAQTVRVYQTNILTHKAHTKTRGEVRGGGTKPWRQKGTGRARAGSNRSPLWVGGGNIFGPRYRDVKLQMPPKMKRAALLSALSAKAVSHEIKIISGLEIAQPKTKSIVNLLSAIGLSGSTLFVVPQKNENLKLATRNLQKVNLEVASNLNALTVITYQNILWSKEALEKVK